MAVFTAVNFLAMRIFAKVNNVITWWKVAVPILAIIVLMFEFDPGNFTAGGEPLFPGGIKGLTAALPLSGIIFAYSGFEQADQLAGEIKDPGRNLPRRSRLNPDRHRDLHRPADRVHWCAAPERNPARAPAHHRPSDQRGAVRAVATLVGLSWLAHILRIDAFISPSGTGLIYTTGTSRVSYGLSRNRYARRSSVESTDTASRGSA